MAQAIFEGCHLEKPIKAESRGLVSLFPEPMNQKAEAVLISNGINVENYMSVQLSAEDFTEDALVIVMEHMQRERILEDFPEADPENVAVLNQLTGEELEAVDPYGGPLQAYGLCYETLNKSIHKLAELLNENGGETGDG